MEKKTHKMHTTTNRAAAPKKELAAKEDSEEDEMGEEAICAYVRHSLLADKTNIEEETKISSELVYSQKLV